jgi:hypothetical protein
MAIQWASNVNKKFYGLDGTPIENRTEIKYKSGRTIYNKINTLQKFSYNVKLYLDDLIKIDDETEFERFINWYGGSNGSGSEAVELPNIQNASETKLYYVTVQNYSGQKHKEVSLTLEEV